MLEVFEQERDKRAPGVVQTKTEEALDIDRSDRRN